MHLTMSFRQIDSTDDLNVCEVTEVLSLEIISRSSSAKRRGDRFPGLPLGLEPAIFGLEVRRLVH